MLPQKAKSASDTVGRVFNAVFFTTPTPTPTLLPHPHYNAFPYPPMPHPPRFNADNSAPGARAEAQNIQRRPPPPPSAAGEHRHKAPHPLPSTSTPFPLPPPPPRQYLLETTGAQLGSRYPLIPLAPLFLPPLRPPPPLLEFLTCVASPPWGLRGVRQPTPRGRRGPPGGTMTCPPVVTPPLGLQGRRSMVRHRSTGRSMPETGWGLVWELG